MTNLRVHPFRTGPSLLRALLLRWFDLRARESLQRRGIATTRATLGYMAEDRIDARYVLRMLDELPPGTYEVRCQPDEEAHAGDLEMLVSTELREGLRERGIDVVRHADL